MNKKLANAFEELDGIEPQQPVRPNSFRSSLDREFDKKTTRPTVNETHKRTTLLVEMSIHEAMQDLSQRKGRGFKTAFINRCLAEGMQKYGYDVTYEVND